MSVIDLSLGWYPLGFGKPEWEFGTISATIAGFAIPTLALYLIFASALALGRTRVVKGIAVGMLVLAVFLATLFLIYLTSVPLALLAVSKDPGVQLGMRKAIVKSLTLFLGYETVFIVGGIKGLRQRRGWL